MEEIGGELEICSARAEEKSALRNKMHFALSFRQFSAKRLDSMSVNIFGAEVRSHDPPWDGAGARWRKVLSVWTKQADTALLPPTGQPGARRECKRLSLLPWT